MFTNLKKNKKNHLSRIVKYQLFCNNFLKLMDIENIKEIESRENSLTYIFEKLSRGVLKRYTWVKEKYYESCDVQYFTYVEGSN